MSLSSLIVQREIASIREIEEALARQVLYGGDFVTNLFEVSRIEEAALMPVVAESFGLPPAPAGELPKVPPEAVRMVAAEVAVERGFAPLAIGSALVVAVAEPLSRDAEQELTFALALPIEQRIAPLFRIRQALSRDYGVPIDKRTARLITKVLHKGPKMASTFPPPKESAPKLPERPPSIPAPPRRAAKDPGKSTLTSAPHSTFVRPIPAPPARPTKRRRGPLTIDVANVELEASAERDVIFDVLFEFARQFFDYTALFIVHGDLAEGRDAFGDGASRDKVARVGVPLDLANILGTARDGKRAVRRIPAREGLDPVLMTDLGRDGTTECVVIPVVVRKRVVALVFGDGGISGIDDTGVRQVEALVEAASGAFERVIVRRKLKGAEAAAGRATDPSAAPAQASAPRAVRASERPSAEELAQPIRDLMSEPASRAPATTNAPMAQLIEPRIDVLSSLGASDRTDRPPPANLLAVRRPSGAPIPREEPESRPDAIPMIRTKSGALKRAEAPKLEFGSPSMPSVTTENAFGSDAAERLLLAQIQGQTARSHPLEPPRTTRDPEHKRREWEPAGVHPWGHDPAEPGDPAAPFTEAPYSPKAASPPPMRSAPVTDLSPQPIGPILPIDREPPPVVIEEVSAGSIGGSPGIEVALRPPALATKVRVAESGSVGTITLMEGMPLPQRDVVEKTAPVSPLVVVTPDEDMKPVPLDDLDPTPVAPPAFLSDMPSSSSAVDPVLALSQRKGAPPLPIPAHSEPKPMPLSEQQVSVPAHKPPSSRSDHTRILPSVIVDVSSEYVTLVDRVLRGPDDDAEIDLLRAGGYAMPAIMARFPGPIALEIDRLDGPLPRVADCGPIIRLVASQRRTALPFVLSHVSGSDPERRFWATYLLTELVYPDAIDAAIARNFDEDPRVRRVARAATRALAEAHPAPVVERLGEIAADEKRARLRVLALEALGESREAVAVAVLLPYLDNLDPEVKTAARAALVTITRQDFGIDRSKWADWWDANRNRHRLEWLIDALMHEHRALRGAASDELRTITKEYFAYYDDLPKRERERAQSRYRDWWENIGRVRFSRASTRGA